MSAVKQTERLRSVPADQEVPAPVKLPEGHRDAWLGDRVAMAVWMCGALIMVFLLLWDLLHSLLIR